MLTHHLDGQISDGTFPKTFRWISFRLIYSLHLIKSPSEAEEGKSALERAEVNDHRKKKNSWSTWSNLAVLTWWKADWRFWRFLLRLHLLRRNVSLFPPHEDCWVWSCAPEVSFLLSEPVESVCKRETNRLSHASWLPKWKHVVHCEKTTWKTTAILFIYLFYCKNSNQFW